MPKCVPPGTLFRPKRANPLPEPLLVTAEPAKVKSDGALVP